MGKILKTERNELHMRKLCIDERRQLLVSYYQDVVRYLGKFGLDKEDLRDAINETYVNAFRAAGSLQDEESARGWLIVIARNVGLKYKRNSNAGAIIECSFGEDVVQLDNEAAYESDVAEEIIRDADIMLLRKCLGRLKETERRVLLLQYYYDEKLQDIADIIGTNLNSTKSIARRAKIKLKNYLIEEGYEYGK